MDYQTNVKMAKQLDERDQKDRSTEKDVILVQNDSESDRIPIHKPEDLDKVQEDQDFKSHLTLNEDESLSMLFDDISNHSLDYKQALTALEQLEYASHYFDVGIAIGHSKKFTTALLDICTSLDLKTELKTSSALVLGYVVSNNPKAIKAILSHTPEIVHTLLSAFQNQLVSSNSCGICLKRLMLVIASLSRTDIDARRDLINASPFSLFLEASKKHSTVKPRIISFLNDIALALDVADIPNIQDWSTFLKDDSSPESMELLAKLNQLQSNFQHQEL